jgi:hypothetical protein
MEGDYMNWVLVKPNFQVLDEGTVEMFQVRVLLDSLHHVLLDVG